jgi:amino acid transporter
MSDTQLKKGRLGVLGIVFFVVAASAPLVGMTGAVPVAIAAGNGAAAVGTYLAVGLVLMLFSVGYTAMSSRVTNTGAFFAYVGRGLGTNAGVASAFTSLVAYITIQLAIYGFFGGLVALEVSARFSIEVPWFVWSLLAWLIVTGLSLLSVDVGAKVLGVLLVLELLALMLTAIAIFANPNNSGIDFLASFSPEQIFAGGFAGAAGIAIAFAFASFIGFEATAIYGEESKNPKRDVPRATYWAVGTITALFTFVSLAMVTGLGASSVQAEVAKLAGDDLSNPAAVLYHLAEVNVGSWMPEVMSILVLSSLFAGLLAFQNAASRYFFALGRGGVLAKRFGTTNKAGAPSAGVVLTSVLALLVMAGFALAGLDGIGNLFFWMSAVAVIAIIFVEILVSIAVVAYFMKEGGENVWRSKIAPIVSAIALAAGLYLLMSRFNLLGSLAPTPERSGNAWDLSTLGWVLVLSPFIAALVGYIFAVVNKKENASLVKDILS